MMKLIVTYTGEPDRDRMVMAVIGSESVGSGYLFQEARRDLEFVVADDFDVDRARVELGRAIPSSLVEIRGRGVFPDRESGESVQEKGAIPADADRAAPDAPATAWTVVTFNAHKDGAINHYEHSTVACCTTLERAREIVETNEVDIHETDEDYAVIERAILDSPYGLAGDFPRPRYWYRWQGKPDDGKYVPCDEPTEVEQIVCWAGF